MMTIGERIFALRRRAGMTQAQLGAALPEPVSSNSVRNWEKDTHPPSAGHLLGLARVLNSTVGYLLGEIGVGGESVEAGPPRARTYDPDELPIPSGLQRLLDLGLPLRRGELVGLLGYADPLNPTRGARGAVNWTPGQWLDVLLAERRQSLEG